MTPPPFPRAVASALRRATILLALLALGAACAPRMALVAAPDLGTRAPSPGTIQPMYLLAADRRCRGCAVRSADRTTSAPPS
jgi:hypothetical protein